METSSVHPSPSGSDCDDNNSVTPVSLDAVVDIANDIVDAGPTVCSTLHAEKNLERKTMTWLLWWPWQKVLFTRVIAENAPRHFQRLLAWLL